MKYNTCNNIYRIQMMKLFTFISKNLSIIVQINNKIIKCIDVIMNLHVKIFYLKIYQLQVHIHAIWQLFAMKLLLKSLKQQSASKLSFDLQLTFHKKATLLDFKIFHLVFTTLNCTHHNARYNYIWNLKYVVTQTPHSVKKMWSSFILTMIFWIQQYNEI